jgi:Regulator of chromosome condensation (RCC1) repeat
MKSLLTSLIISTVAVSAAWADTAPTSVIVSAAMRPGTTLMDVVFRVNDPDDATVKVRALAFVDGVRSFAKVLRPVTFVEGTAAKIGDAIASNTDHTLSWDVAADWNIDLGQVKFEILARDARGLLAFDWITIPAAGGQPALTISKDTPSDESVLSALFWQYADGDSGLTLTNGTLKGNASSGFYPSLILATGSNVDSNGAIYVFSVMGIDLATVDEVTYAANTARAGLTEVTKPHAIYRLHTPSVVFAWGENDVGQTVVPVMGPTGVLAVAAGHYHNLALRGDGTVVGWGGQGLSEPDFGETTVPSGLTDVIAIAAGNDHNLALKGDGTVVAWGSNANGQTTIPIGLAGVTAIAAGRDHSLALKDDGTVVAWGLNHAGQTNIPAGLIGVTAIAAGNHHNLALKNDGTVVAWGFNIYRQTTIPGGLAGVAAIAAGEGHSVALKGDGTVVAWGYNSNGQTLVPPGLTGVTAIAAGEHHTLALKSDGTVVGWGYNERGETTIPLGLNGIIAIAGGRFYSVALKSAVP